jgi:transposase
MNTIKHTTVFEFNKRYGSEKACLEDLLKIRAGEEGKCFRPGCRGNVYHDYKKLQRRKAFLCRKCLLHFYPMAGTIFDHSHIELQEWFCIMFKMLYMRNGVSALEIHRETGHSYRTIYGLMNTIRSLMGQGMDFTFDNTYVEVDEGYEYTGNKGYSRHHHFGTGRGSLKSTSILALVERGGKVKLYKISDTKADTLIDIIKQNISKDCIIFTDSFASYSRLKKEGYNHATVNHEQHEYVNHITGASTNAAENVFGNISKNHTGTYRKLSEDRLQLYLYEQAFRHSYREEKDYGFEILLKLIPSIERQDSSKAA